MTDSIDDASTGGLAPDATPPVSYEWLARVRFGIFLVLGSTLVEFLSSSLFGMFLGLNHPIYSDLRYSMVFWIVPLGVAFMGVLLVTVRPPSIDHLSNYPVRLATGVRVVAGTALVVRVLYASAILSAVGFLSSWMPILSWFNLVTILAVILFLVLLSHLMNTLTGR